MNISKKQLDEYIATACKETKKATIRQVIQLIDNDISLLSPEDKDLFESEIHAYKELRKQVLKLSETTNIEPCEIFVKHQKNNKKLC